MPQLDSSLFIQINSLVGDLISGCAHASIHATNRDVDTNMFPVCSLQTLMATSEVMKEQQQLPFFLSLLYSIQSLNSVN